MPFLFKPSLHPLETDSIMIMIMIIIIIIPILYTVLRAVHILGIPLSYSGRLRYFGTTWHTLDRRQLERSRKQIYWDGKLYLAAQGWDNLVLFTYFIISLGKLVHSCIRALTSSRYEHPCQISRVASPC